MENQSPDGRIYMPFELICCAKNNNSKRSKTNRSDKYEISICMFLSFCIAAYQHLFWLHVNAAGLVSSSHKTNHAINTNNMNTINIYMMENHIERGAVKAIDNGTNCDR